MRGVADPAFPGLAVALDADGFLELLRCRLPECPEEVEIVGGKIVDVQYTPGAKGLVLYQLKLRPGSGGRSRRQLVFARALAVDESPTPPPPEHLARYGAFPDRVLRTPYLGLVEAGLEVHAFPLDPVLPQLAEAFDPVAMKHAFGRVWDDRGVRVLRVKARTLGYTPQARAAIRYEVLSEARETRVPEVRHLVGKLHATRPASALFARAWALWRGARLKVRLAPPVGFTAAPGLTLQEWVVGERLGDLAGSGTFVKPLRDVARSLARLHGLSVPLSALRPARREITVVQRWANVLAALRGGGAIRVERLRDAISAQLEARIRLSGPVHGDFHPANVLVNDGRATIIDLDQLAYGDPLIDVGRFLASLRVSALRVGSDPSALHADSEAFLESYLSQSSADESRLRLFEAACLMMAAAAGFRLQRSGWEESSQLLFEEAERVFARAGQQGAVRVAMPQRREPPPPTDRAAWAMEPVYLRAALDAHVSRLYGADLRSVRARARPQHGAGLRIRYRVRGRRDGADWSVSLHATDGARRDKRLFERLETLREALEAQPEALLLPRPVAYLPELGIKVIERPRGTRFASLVDTPAGPEVTQKLARGLAAVHGAAVRFARTRSLERALRGVQRGVEALAAQEPALYRRAVALLGPIEARLRAVEVRQAPVLRRLPLAQLRCSDGRIGLAQVEDLALSHPLLDVGDLLVRLALLGIERERGAAAAVAAKHLREAYVSAAGVRHADVASFEALALLRVACSRAIGGAPASVTERLFGLADSSLDASQPRGARARRSGREPAPARQGSTWSR